MKPLFILTGQPRVLAAIGTPLTRYLFISCLFVLTACGNPVGSDSQGRSSPKLEEGEVVRPPFSVRGDAEGLLLTWWDDKGLHTASNRSAVPVQRRQRVRVDSLSVSPDKRLDPDYVYVADLRSPRASGEYVVRKMTRETFDAWVDSAVSAKVANSGKGGVIIYGASWCGACRSAAQYFRRRGVSFVEKDIEKEPDAAAEMQRKAKAAGFEPRGIPVIDVRGTILPGFDPDTIERLLGKAI